MIFLCDVRSRALRRSVSNLLRSELINFISFICDLVKMFNFRVEYRHLKCKMYKYTVRCTRYNRLFMKRPTFLIPSAISLAVELCKVVYNSYIKYRIDLQRCGFSVISVCGVENMSRVLEDARTFALIQQQ